MIDITKNELYIRQIISFYSGIISQRKCGQKSRKSDGFVFIWGGECLYNFFDGSSFAAKKGDVIYLSKGDGYDMDVRSEKYEYLVVDFDFEGDKKRQSRLFTLRSPESAESLFHHIMKSKTQSDSMASLYRLYSLLFSSVKGSYIGRKNEDLIRQSIEIIRERLPQEIEISKIAEELRISTVYFRKIFKAAMGVSPLKYITVSRINYAKRLLDSQIMTLEEVALQSGFSSLPYFCKVFKESTGMTPSIYKKLTNL